MISIGYENLVEIIDDKRLTTISMGYNYLVVIIVKQK
jgi:hypothetical protein|tara:strand:- start:2278 stop:2388 length:111 start_codon:yes stop_codon:yes gene_type:complete